MKYFLLRAAAMLSPIFAAALVVQPASAAPFAVTGPTPTQAFVNAATEYTGTYESASTTVEHCELSIDGVLHGTMTLNGTPLNGTAKRTASISTAGSHVVRVTCTDDGTSTSIYSEATVTVFADSAAPSVGTFSYNPTSVVAGTAVTISSNFDDTDFGSGIDSCTLFLNGTSTGAMSLAGASTAGTASKSYTFSAGGSYTVKIDCQDRSGNVGTRTETLAVATPPDSTNPVVGPITPTTATVGVAVNVQASASDNVGVASCELEVNGVNQGGMTVASGIASKAISFTIVGNNAVKVTCRDAAGNIGSNTSLITVVAASTDSTPPVVSGIGPLTVTAGIAVTLAANYSDAGGVASCNLYVNGVLVGSMDRTGATSGTATRTHTFSGSGSASILVSCTDNAGNSGTGTATVTVNAAGTNPYANRLVKLVCPAGAVDVNHPCKAVYYVGSDAKRHAFPNERVYFTWYANFNGIVELNGGTMATIALGSNVNYRPGVRMVKFTTVNRVYAVARYGTLRWVTSESVATSLYGSNWNTKIDDINDAFYTDYLFGADITNPSQYNPTAETASVTTIDANLR